MPQPRDEDLLRAIGARFQRIRVNAGWRQEDLAEAVGIEPATVSRFEGGHRTLSFTVLNRAAQALGVRLGDLVDVHRPTPAQPADPEEIRLHRLWRKIPADRRRMALRILKIRSE